MDNHFAHNITALRKDKGLSQKQVAADLKISQALLSHYEKGIRECGLDFVVKMSNYFDVSCDYLLGVHTENKSIKTKNSKEQKTINSSVTIVFDMLEKINSKNLSKEVTHYLNFAVYTILRYICKEDEAFFDLDKDSFSALTSAKMTLCKANIKKTIKKEVLNEKLINVQTFMKKENEIKLLVEKAEIDD
ncbi:MAG: helix-turn-helix transcriptional regulator [Clostridia bacterium]